MPPLANCYHKKNEKNLHHDPLMGGSYFFKVTLNEPFLVVVLRYLL